MNFGKKLEIEIRKDVGLHATSREGHLLLFLGLTLDMALTLLQP